VLTESSTNRKNSKLRNLKNIPNAKAYSVYNRKGFRYTHCIADPEFRFMQYHRQSETEPFNARFDYEDSSSHIRFDREAKAVSTEKGFRMARANVGLREGRWYWECKVLSGVKNPNNPDSLDGEAGGHVRMGLSRREAPLETPVGFDAYSYGIRDLAGQKIHRSRPQDFFPQGESICEGDVIGFEIQLPSLALHRKVVDGTYNKAVDVSDEVDPHNHEAPNIIRDRLPIRYKSQVYFEQFEYTAIKEVEELTYPPSINASTTAAASQAPNPNHPLVALRTLPNSHILVYKNGQPMGPLYKELLAFLPLASKPATQSGVVGAREGLDDGMLGYYPSISVFQGGAAEANFGPHFWHPPPGYRHPTTSSDGDIDMADSDAIPEAANTSEAATQRFSLKRLRPISERYEEQIAEDITYDILDEVDLWMTDGGSLDARIDVADGVPLLPGTLDVEMGGMDGASDQAIADGIGVQVRQGDLNEIVQDEE
jgi:COMPASS component BRE2